MAAKIAGQLWDLTRPIENAAEPQNFELINRDSPDGLEIIRHDTAHVMAQAIQELYPDTQITIGPNIEDGFFYDFARTEKFSTDDFEKIENRMKEIVDRDLPITREEWTRDVAIKHFNEIGEKYKASIIEEIIPEGETLTIYKQGDVWKDLCRGPHMPSTGRLGKAFKLMKLAGAYWRGDAKNAQLQRIYGTAWADEKGLQEYLLRLEEAERRDHRKLGRQLDLFHMQEEGKGMVFWHPKGWVLYRILENYIRRMVEKSGYGEVKTPQILDRSLWEASGHWEKFGHAMFTCETEEGEHLAVKPMNCPGHVQIFNQGQKSYRDLPLRMAEMGCCHRFEPSGSLHGIMRVRNFTQDDGHIFCRDDQIFDETKAFCETLAQVYADLDVELHSIKLALRPEIRLGSDETWDYTEKTLKAAAEATGVEVELLPGEGAFYGPKLEFHVKDAIGRTWQCGTLQLDPSTPDRLGAHYTAEDGSKQVPIMLHRAILGTFERFLGIMIENYAGHFPLWLAPVQVVVANITSESEAYASEVVAKLKAVGIRAEIDTRNEKINYKVREHSLGKIPVIAVVGAREAAEQKVALRRLGSQEQTILTLDETLAVLTAEGTPPDLR